MLLQHTIVVKRAQAAWAESITYCMILSKLFFVPQVLYLLNGNDNNNNTYLTGLL